jgi:hypothetical protein
MYIRACSCARALQTPRNNLFLEGTSLKTNRHDRLEIQALPRRHATKRLVSRCRPCPARTTMRCRGYMIKHMHSMQLT